MIIGLPRLPPPSLLGLLRRQSTWPVSRPPSIHLKRPKVMRNVVLHGDSRPPEAQVRMSADAVAQAVSGVVTGTCDVVVSGAEVDSRLVREGDLFVALPGERVDGHTFVPKALEKAAAALVREDVELPPPPVGRALISVADPLAAYHHLAASDCHRRGWKVATVTGSVGKTTTKDFLALILKDHRITGSSLGNRNSTLGLPAQILSQDESIEVFVAEAGMSRAGELDLLGGILRPDVVLYTRIAPAHTEFFTSMDGIVEAKAELLPHLKPEGTLVVNATDPRQEEFSRRTDANVLSYGGANSEARLEAVEDLGMQGTRGILVLPPGRTPFRLPLPGLYQAENFLAAATAAHALGLGVEAIAAAAEALEAAPHRGTVLHIHDGITIIDDSYNASPEAVKKALELLAQCSGRRVAVLGEMYELGSAAAAAHRDVGRLVARHCDLLLSVGRDMSTEVLEGAVAAGLPRHLAFQAEDSAAATSVLEGLLEPEDTILVKGSRGVGLDRMVAALSEGRS